MFIQFFIWLFVLFRTEKLGFELLLFLFITIMMGKFIYYVVASRNFIDLFNLLLSFLVA